MSMRAHGTSVRAAAAAAAIASAAIVVRVIFPAADPPWNPSVGIVWHDEGAWVHSARNRALYGTWFIEKDVWNPLFIAPVFTGLEYLSFAAFGVGVRQARVVSEVAGLASVVLLALGVRRVAGCAAGIIAGALVATNYVYVMYNRAALMETTMVAFMVAAWYCYVRAGSDLELAVFSRSDPGVPEHEKTVNSRSDPNWTWGVLAGTCALLAFFTKAAAAFFVLALGADALFAALRRGDDAHAQAERRAGRVTLAGLAAAGLVAVVTFVGPNWESYQFYNWQMSVTRKPTYGLEALADRASWFPILHDLFTRMWFVIVVSIAGTLTMLARGRRLPAGERLLVLWIALGALELVLHDVGNERRFIFFIPAFIAVAAIVLGGRREGAPAELADISRMRALVAAPAVLFAFYVVAGGIARVFFLYEISPAVRIAAACALIGTIAVYLTWPRIPRWLARQRWGLRGAFAATLLVCLGDVAQYVQWAAGRTYKNYEASLAIGRALPPGTSVHGKLANGLALENQIRPVFVGRGFGNYEDRKHRDDVRYILTYIEPRVGYEGPVIQDVLDVYPQRRIIMTFDVAETTGGHDRAALIDKFGRAPRPERGAGPTPADPKDRAHD